ncbi:MAG: GNAT family N-acetyltransferase [Lentimicrobium sp.]|nr:GNAT family N-acetyltransferase [Lentimicrobium sp.]
MSLEAINIRVAELSDMSNLVVLKQQVWVATYAEEGIRAEFSDYLLATFTLENEKALLENTQKKTLVAEHNGHLIGCAVIAFDEVCPLPANGHNPEIAVLYVLERFTGMGLGKILLDKALQEIKESGFDAAWLTVYHKNERAIDFYKKYGFTDIGIAFFEMQGNQYENRVLINHF